MRAIGKQGEEQTMVGGEGHGGQVDLQVRGRRGAVLGSNVRETCLHLHLCWLSISLSSCVDGPVSGRVRGPGSHQGRPRGPGLGGPSDQGHVGNIRPSVIYWRMEEGEKAARMSRAAPSSTCIILMWI